MPNDELRLVIRSSVADVTKTERLEKADSHDGFIFHLAG